MNRHVAAVLGAGALWGFMGLFSRRLAGLGLGSAGALIVRCGIAALFFGLTLLIKDKKLFKVKLRDLWCFLGAGIMSLLFFTFCYFQAISLMSLSTAAILLYTAPAIVMVMSALIFGERLNSRSVLALVMAFAGCVLVSGLGGSVSAAGFVYGICSGLGYALYSIFARLALLRGYDSRTINFYACLLCTAGAALLWGGAEPLAVMTSSVRTALWCLATGIITCYLPYLLYTYGLTGLKTGTASVMASVEPVVATFVGILIFREPMSFMSVCGTLLVLGAVLVLNGKRKENA